MASVGLPPVTSSMAPLDRKQILATSSSSSSFSVDSRFAGVTTSPHVNAYVPPSPSSSTHSTRSIHSETSELSWGGDDDTESDAESTTSTLLTPPASPTRTAGSQFHTSADHAKGNQEMSMSDRTTSPLAPAHSRSSSIGASAIAINQRMSTTPTALHPSTPSKSYPGAEAEAVMRSLLLRRPGSLISNEILSNSSSNSGIEKKRQSPGRIDLSGLRTFPSEYLAPMEGEDQDDNCDISIGTEQDMVRGLKSKNAGKIGSDFSTPNYASSLATTTRSSSASGSTPRAIPDRPGLISRWSTDSEDEIATPLNDLDINPNAAEEEQDEIENEKDVFCAYGRNAHSGNIGDHGDTHSIVPATVGEEQTQKFRQEERDERDFEVCPHCNASTESAEYRLCAAEDAGSEEEHPESSDAIPPPSFSTKRPAHYNPFFLAPIHSCQGWDKILSPLPATLHILPPAHVSNDADVDTINKLRHNQGLFPPAPKPHQHGFSPFFEPGGESPAVTGLTVDGSINARRSSNPYFRSVSSPLPSSASASNSADVRTCSQGHTLSSRLRPRPAQCASSASASSSSPLSSPSSPCPSHNQPAQRLTRSQGLRIRDSYDRPQGRFARSLSTSLSAAVTANGGMASPRQTANALLEGTISPAATSTNPQRIRLREMPGLKTPDVTGIPGTVNGTMSRSRSFGASSGSSNAKISPSLSNLDVLSSPQLSPYSRTPASPAQWQACSPLHSYFLPGDSCNTHSRPETSPTSTTTFTMKAKREKDQILTPSFNLFGNRISPSSTSMRKPSISPTATLKPVMENKIGESDNPYFAGYA